jgi:hypothetical protein
MNQVYQKRYSELYRGVECDIASSTPTSRKSSGGSDGRFGQARTGANEVAVPASSIP